MGQTSTSNRVAALALSIAIAMLWVPVGQHAFLAENWMKLGTFMAPFLLLIAFTFNSNGDWLSNPRATSLFLLIAYIVHQFEEHWVDLYGRNFAFKPYLNSFLSSATGQQGLYEFISDEAIFVVNTSLVWLVGALAIWRGSNHIFATLCMAAVVVVNALSHIVSGLINGSYNPGLLSAAFVFLPMGCAVYAQLLRSHTASLALMTLSLVWGLLAHVILIGGLLAMYQLKWLTEAAYFAALIAWSLLPAFLFPTGGSNAAARSVLPNFRGS